MNELLDRVLEDCGYRDNPYFQSLRDGSMDFDDFVETQIQFYFAVVFFSRLSRKGRATRLETTRFKSTTDTATLRFLIVSERQSSTWSWRMRR